MPYQNLLACLQREQSALQSFIELLEEEGKALADRAAPAVLSQITASKTEAGDHLAALGDARDTALAALGLAGGHAGTDAAAQACPDTAVAWQALLDTTSIAKQLNERNGVLISTHLRFNRDALNALRAAAGATLYGANGRQPGHIGNLGPTRRA